MRRFQNPLAGDRMGGREWRKWFATILYLALAFSAPALITNNLVADWQGGVGITAAGGRISRWNDQHALLNSDGLTNDLTQATATAQPYNMRDAHGYPGVMFPWGVNGSGVLPPNTFLNIPASLGGLKTTNTTVYVVATGPVGPDQSQTLVWFAGGGASSAWIRFYRTGYVPVMFCVGQLMSSAIYAPINRAVFVASGGATRTTTRWNNVVQTNGPQTSVTTGSGGMIASNGSEYFSGIVYRILVYSAAHTTVQMDAQVAELAALHGVLTNYTRQVVCRGDSIPAGVDTTLLQSFPFQLWQRYPEIRWYNQGVGGLLIGTNGGTGQMFNVDGTFVDLLYDASLEQNWLFFWGGVNDMGQGLAGAATYGRLTNYVAARKAAHPWQVIVSTVQSRSGHDAQHAELNSCVRTNAGGWDAFVDPGLNSPIETRLNNSANTNYFYTDQLHLINAGQSVIADHFGQTVNVPHRATGFFSP